MNILVVSENFSRGGLETNINTLHNELKKHNKLVYAFGKYEKTSYLNDAKIYSDFHFNYDVTIADFCSDVDRLVKIIEAEKIDVVQVHPFYSVYQAFFATQLTGTKLVYTCHGYGSLTFTPNLFDEILLEYIFEKGVSLNIGVSEKLCEMSRQQGNNNFLLLPNPIDLDAYKQTKVLDNKKWALVSRLDIDKYGAIKKLFEMLPKLNIESIDVYGEGTEKKKLENMAKRKKLNVSFKGYVDNINEVTLDKYNGVIGLGRVAIEGLAMGYPVLFIGYDRVVGLIDKKIYERAKKLNFVPEYFDDISINDLNKQINNMSSNKLDYYIRDQIKEEFDVRIITEQYIKEIKNASFINNQSKAEELFNKIKKVNKKNQFHISEIVADIVYNFIKYDTRNMFIKNKILLHGDVTKNKQEIINLKNEIRELRQFTCETIDDKVNYIISNVNSKWIIKNDLKKIFKRRKNGKN